MQKNFFLFISFLVLVIAFCYNEEDPMPLKNSNNQSESLLQEFDLKTWMNALPIGTQAEVEPPELLDHLKNTISTDFKVNHTSVGSLVFFTNSRDKTSQLS